MPNIGHWKWRKAMSENAFFDIPEEDQVTHVECELSDIVFVGFNSRVAALNRNTGKIV